MNYKVIEMTLMNGSHLLYVVRENEDEEAFKKLGSITRVSVSLASASLGSFGNTVFLKTKIPEALQILMFTIYDKLLKG